MRAINASALEAQWRTSRRISTEPPPSFNSGRDIPSRRGDRLIGCPLAAEPYDTSQPARGRRVNRLIIRPVRAVGSPPGRGALARFKRYRVTISGISARFCRFRERYGPIAVTLGKFVVPVRRCWRRYGVTLQDKRRGAVE